jgi:hypothetical protein
LPAVAINQQRSNKKGHPKVALNIKLGRRDFYTAATGRM